MNHQPIKPLLTINELAKILNISPATIRSHRAKGNHPIYNHLAITLDGHIRWNPDDITNYLQQQTTQKQPPKTHK